MTDRNRQPFSKLAALWQHESRNGATYFVGRIGDLKLFVMENRDYEEGSNEPTHFLLTKHEPRERPRGNGDSRQAGGEQRRDQKSGDRQRQQPQQREERLQTGRKPALNRTFDFRDGKLEERR